MKDIDQLAIALYQLKKLEDVDININIPVINDTLRDCVKLNKKIISVNKSPISFHGNRLIFPHVTLKMGTVKNGCFENLLFKLNDFAKNIKPMDLSFQQVILKSPANNYYFCEVDDDRLIALSKDLDILLNDEMSLPKFPLSKDNLHHVTLGYKYPDDLEIAPIIGELIASFRADRIQVSVKGKFGVCIGVLKTFNL